MTARRECGSVALIVLVAAGLRLWMPGAAILTVDEEKWLPRSAAFREAVAQEDFASAVAAPRGVPATQPGVTTMWIGTAAIESLEHLDGETLRRSHQFVGVVCSLWLIPFILAARRLVGSRPALIAGGVLAVEPLLVGHSALLHTDALMTMSSGTAVVALLAAFEALRHEEVVGDDGRSWLRCASMGWMALAGMSAAFALLTKVTVVVVLVSAVAAAMLVHLLLRGRAWHRGEPVAWSRVLGRLAVVVGMGAVVTVAVSVVAWPALWVTPRVAVQAAVESAELADQAQPRLFLGEVIRRGDWRYYPVEAYFRVSPWVFVMGIGAVVASGVRAVRRGRRLLPRRISFALVAVAVPYLLVISSGEKQYARYLLPLLPLAAIALAVAADQWLSRAGHRTASLLAWAVFAGTAAWTFSLAPYQISHVNPLVGGQRAAETKIPLGWGEGKEQVGADYRLPSPCPTYSSASGWNSAYFERHGCVREPFWWFGTDGTQPELVYRYVYNRQRGQEPPGLEPYLFEHGELEFTVTIGGVHYVEVWRLREPASP